MRAYRRDGTVQELDVSIPPPRVWLVHEWAEPPSFRLDDPLKVRTVLLRRKTLRYGDEFVGPMECDDVRWRSQGSLEHDRGYWLWKCARPWGLEWLGVGATLLYAVALYDCLTDESRFREWREYDVLVEDGAPRWSPA
jgi:hypothetical protein